MIERFLKAKHWQLFILISGIPFALQSIFMFSIFSHLETNTNPNLDKVFDNMKFAPMIMLVFIAIIFGWLWSVAIGLQKKVPDNITMKVKKFKIFFFIPIVYILCLMFFMTFVMNGLIDGGEPNAGLIRGIVFVIVPIHLFSIFGIFYTFYFAAKTIKTVELQREVKFSDFGSELVMIWVFPVGIWLIQPKINKFIEP